jgi:hypothetical protein
MHYLILLLLITGCSSTATQLANIERENVVLRDRVATLQEKQQQEYIELINAQEALRKFERRQELDWPLPSCKAD